MHRQAANNTREQKRLTDNKNADAIPRQKDFVNEREHYKQERYTKSEGLVNGQQLRKYKSTTILRYSGKWLRDLTSNQKEKVAPNVARGINAVITSVIEERENADDKYIQTYSILLLTVFSIFLRSFS